MSARVFVRILTFALLGPKLIRGTFSVDNNIKNRDGYAAYGYAPQSYGSSYPVAGGAEHGGLDIVSDVLIGALAALAGLALLSTLVNTLGAAFAFFIGRKKRDIVDDNDFYSPDVQRQIEQMKMLQDFIQSLPDVSIQPEKMVANYLSCSGLANERNGNGNGNHCLERLSCEFNNAASNFTKMERNAVSVISNTILSNKFVPPDFRRKLRIAGEQGKHNGNCHLYTCTEYFKRILTS